VRKQALDTDVRTSEELAVAVANGIHPARIVVHGDTMSDPELRCAANVGVGPGDHRLFRRSRYRALCNEKRIQAVLLGMKDPRLCGGGCIDDAMVTVLAHRRLLLSGLQARIGLRATEFVSCAAAIGGWGRRDVAYTTTQRPDIGVWQVISR
jgi:diaminopimelate decarboxylase